MSTTSSGSEDRRAWKWALYGAIEAAVIGAAVTALITGLVFGSDVWLQRAGYVAILGAIGGAIGGALYGGKRGLRESGPEVGTIAEPAAPADGGRDSGS